jgi:hypothetical protein
MVNALPAAHACVTCIVHGPEPVTESAPGVHVPTDVVVLVAVGTVHPAGTTKVTYELV